MNRPQLIFLFAVALASAAAAQPAPGGQNIERVVVTAPKWLGDKPSTIIHKFVGSYAQAATPTVGEIARWKYGICARTYGLSQPEYNTFVTDRVEDIAVKVGLLVKPTGCHLNIEIVFTDQPQEFLDQVHKIGARLLGPKPSHADTVGVMRYAVQAWYATGTRDISGNLMVDDEDNAGFNAVAGADLLHNVFATYTGVSFYGVEGFKWRTGLNSELAHIYVVADTRKTAGMELGAVADYVTMLTLSQTQNFDDCRPIPSISNLIASGCAAELKPAALTDFDLAYLRAVYRMDPGANLQQQQNFIAGQIADALGIK